MSDERLTDVLDKLVRTEARLAVSRKRRAKEQEQDAERTARLRERLALLRDEVRRQDEVYNALYSWCLHHGKELSPGHRPDTFGEGVRAAKENAKRVLQRMEQ